MEVFLNPHFPAFKSTVGVLPSPVVWARCNVKGSTTTLSRRHKAALAEDLDPFAA